MDLRQLEIFLQVAALGSFSRAAAALRLTQPTVSEHIRSLEEDLGVRLLDRLGRGASVTPAGQVLMEYAQRMVALQREARQAVDAFQGSMSGELLVGASTIPGEYVLPAVVGRFKAKYPEISITLLIADSQTVVDWVVEGRVELGVVGARLPQRLVDYRELMSDEEVVILPPGHRWQGRTQVSVEELRAEPMIVRERGSGTRAALEATLAAAGVDLGVFRIVGEMGTTGAIKQAVRAGVGVSVVSRRAVEEECRQGTLICLSVADLRVLRAFHVVIHRERSRSPLAETFRAFLECEAV